MSVDPTAPVMQKLHPREAVKRMHEYHPPLAGRDGLRLDFNENTFAPSPCVQAVLQRIAADTLTKYPERHHVEQIVAKHFGVAEDAVLLTNGVDEAIHLLCETYLEPQDEAVIVTPTFSMYALYAEATGARVVEVQADSSLQFPYAACTAGRRAGHASDYARVSQQSNRLRRGQLIFAGARRDGSASCAPGR